VVQERSHPLDQRSVVTVDADAGHHCLLGITDSTER
jgi:hypothetical protein